MKEKYPELREYNNELLGKQSSLKEALLQKRSNLEKIAGEKDNAVASILRVEHRVKLLNEEIGSKDKEHKSLLTGCGEVGAEISRLAATRSDMQQQYNDLSSASECIRLEISRLEASRNDAQKQYDTIIANNGQIKMEIANRDNAQSTYSLMINHNNSANSAISNLSAERDNIQNQQINPYINALAEARNALGGINANNYYYNVTVEKKHTVRGLFGIKLDPKYTYHTETRFNQDGYNKAVGDANIRIGNAENRLNIQKANYQGKINTLNTEISSKQSSLYSSVQIQQALQALNSAQGVLGTRGITLETSEQQVASALKILNDASSALKSRQIDLSNNEQQKGQVAEAITMTDSTIHARENDLKALEQEASKIGIMLKEKQVISAGLEEEIGNHRQVLENLDSSFKYTKEEIIGVEEACRACELDIIAAKEKVEAARLEAERLQAREAELERLEAERIKAEQLEARKVEAEKLANTEKVETVEDIFGINENQILALEQAVVSIDLSGDV